MGGGYRDSGMDMAIREQREQLAMQQQILQQQEYIRCVVSTTALLVHRLFV